jgi:error-prone DNA polymerase
MYGVPKFLAACEESGVSPIVGAEITVESSGERGHLVLLCESMEGYASLCRLITRYRTSGVFRTVPTADGDHLSEHPSENPSSHPSAKERRFPACPLETLLEEVAEVSAAPGGSGLVCLTGSMPHGLIAGLVERGKWRAAKRLLYELAEAFGEGSLYVELTDDRTRFARNMVRRVAGLADECGLPTIATNEVTYVAPEDHRLSEAMWASYNTTSLPGPYHRPTDQLYLKPSWKMERLFGDHPDRSRALRNTAEVALRCAGAVSLGGEVLVPAYLQHSLYRATKELREGCNETSARERLLSLVLRGVRKHYGKPTPEIKARLRRELSCIGKLGFTSYFLFANEAKEIAHEKGTPVTGRGSGANSMVAYCLGLTQPEPMEHRLLFERFMHEGRTKDPPDIDMDMCSELRDEVRDELISRYSSCGAGVAATAATFSLRGGVRAAARALGYSPAEIDGISRHVPRRIRDRDMTLNPNESSTWGHALKNPAMKDHVLQDKRRYTLLLDLAEKLAGRLHQPGTHLGGLVVGTDQRHLSEIVPMEHSGKEGLLRVQYDKDDLEYVGLPKLDVLGLKMHTALRKAGALVSQSTGEKVDPLSPPPGDKATYALIRTGENAGMFQLESPGQMALSRRLKPRRLSDITASISLFRPGPVRGDLVTPYVRRRNGQEAYSVPLPELNEVLRLTYGVLIYQEQILEVAHRVAGFSLAEADGIRRAMTKSRGPGAMDGIKREFLKRSTSRGVPVETAREIVDWIEGFAAYGFSAAHAASFAELSYASAYMRTRYPAEYFASLLNSQPMGFYSPRVLLNEARRVGITILPPDVHLSGEECTVEKFEGDGTALRVSLSYCKGLSRRGIEAIIEERRERSFASAADLYHRTPVDSRALGSLIKGGFLDSLGASLSGGRRELLDGVSLLPKKRKGDVQRELAGSPTSGVGSSLEDGWWHERPDDRRIASLPFPPGEEERMQRAVLSLDVAEHPLRAYREELKRLKVTPARKIRDMPTGSRVRAAGIMECLQSPPTKSGKAVYFLLLEDETGLLQATIFSDVHQRYGHHLYRAASFLLEGAVEQDDKRGFSFVVDKIEDLGALLPQALERHGSVAGSGAMLRAPKPSTGKPDKRTRAS